jgi:hypothetical protein
MKSEKREIGKAEIRGVRALFIFALPPSAFRFCL